MNSFLEFYNKLDTIDLVLIWVGIFALVIIVGLAVYLYRKNKQLVNLIKNKEKELISKEKEIENSRIKNKETMNKLTDIKKNIDNIENKEVVKIINDEIKEIDIDKDNKAYNKNVLKDKRSYQTSPINIIKDKKEEVNKKENINFMENIAKKMEEELKPQTIELTDFEKKQEEEAIISYQELLSTAKDKVYQITDDEETTDFIEELKSFRSEL